MATPEIHHIPVLGDHYIWLVREPDSGDRAVVDPAVSGPVQSKLKELGWRRTSVRRNQQRQFKNIPEGT